MRHLAALAFFLSACAPPAPQPPADAPAAPAPAPSAGGPYAAALSANPHPGQWIFNGDGATISAGFGAPESEYIFLVICNEATANIALRYAHELVPDQDTILRIITTTQTLDLPARSFNEGLPSVNAELERTDAETLPLIGMLGAPTDRFAVEIAGEISVFPWDQSIANTLIACR